MNTDKPDKMSDFEVALMDAIRTIFEILVAKKIIPAEVAAEMLRRQRETYQQEPPMPGAIFVMNMLVESLTDPKRLATRKLERDPPQGSA
jgi:hypothetical protein